MRLEAALKHFSPQGLAITDSSSCTSGDRITGTDVMAALGVTQSKARFGMAAFLGKTGISNEDRDKAIQVLTQYAMRQAPKHVGKVTGRKMAICMHTLAALAYEEYSHSAGASVTCHHCHGKGLLESWQDVKTYPGYIGADGEEKIPPTIKRQIVHAYCQPCKGKGKIHKRCRNCKGTGKALDREATKANGIPVIKDCERCNGNGFSRMPSSVAYRAIVRLIPDLHERTWRRNWKPFYESLVAKCEVEESIADGEFSRITR